MQSPLNLKDTLVFPDAAGAPRQQHQQQILELDELCSFVYRKSQKVWVWLALWRETRQVVAFVEGDRSRERAASVCGGPALGVTKR